jgi:hypothetical protein
MAAVCVGCLVAGVFVHGTCPKQIVAKRLGSWQRSALVCLAPGFGVVDSGFGWRLLQSVGEALHHHGGCSAWVLAWIEGALPTQ